MLGKTAIRGITPLVAALTLATACSENDPLGPADVPNDVSSVAPAQQVAPIRPLKQWSRGTMAAVGPCTGGVRFAAAGAGRASHVGRFQIELLWCMDPASGAILDGTATVVAANDDRIDMNLGGKATSQSQLNMTASIVGGSGRFEDAAGVLLVEVSLAADGSWSSTGTGSISY